MLLKNWPLAILVCLLPFLSYSQSDTNTRSLKVGFGLSGFSYLGDFATGNGSLQRVYPGANFSIHTESQSSLQLQLNGGFGKFAAQYDGENTNTGQLIHTFVETPFYYGDLRLRYRFLKGSWQPYAAIGAGILVFSPRDENGKPLKFIDESREEGESYNTIIPRLPISLGVERQINDKVSAGINYTLHYTPTDYLDNVGSLGSKPGKDILHAITLNLSVSLFQRQSKTSKYNSQNSVSLDSSSQTIAKEDTSSLVSQKEPPMDSVATLSPTPTLPLDTAIVEDHLPTPEKELIISKTTELQRTKIEAAIAANKFIYHRVEKGDELTTIAEKYHMDIGLLRKLNYLKSDELKEGVYLRIPDVE